jgi:hypothetical protein
VLGENKGPKKTKIPKQKQKNKKLNKKKKK